MRNLLLILLLANLLLLAWRVWVAPPPVSRVRSGDAPGLALFGGTKSGAMARRSERPPGPVGDCVRIGPFQDASAAARAVASIAARGIDSRIVAVEGQVWVGHWVQVSGFATAEQAETARQQLVQGGVPDAYLMQEDASNTISLGVFREKEGADRVAARAAALSLTPVISDRFRTSIEQWVQLQPPAGRGLDVAELGLPDTRILRAEATPCMDAVPAPPPVVPDAAAPSTAAG